MIDVCYNAYCIGGNSVMSESDCSAQASKPAIYSKYYFNFIVQDDFLDEHDFCKLLSLLPDSEQFEFDKVTIASNTVDLFGNVINNECIPEKLLRQIHSRYRDRLILMLSTISPLKRGLVDYFDYHLVVTGKFYKELIHFDAPNKLLSVAIYLSPTINRGTVLYPSHDKNSGAIEIPWKPNRAFIFSRIKNKTWHSYAGNKLLNRLVMVINVGTNRIDQVEKIEQSKEFLDSYSFSA